jgi:hypothetical protein
MKKPLYLVALGLLVLFVAASCSMEQLGAEYVVEDQGVDACLRRLTFVRISGKAVHFLQTMDVDYARISILERPRRRPVITDAEGNFRIWIVKPRGVTIDCSFVMKHPNFPESQTGVIRVGDEDIDDVTIQVIDNEYLYLLKAGLEQGLSDAFGVPYTIDLQNSCQVVTTAGKVWASMLVDKFPHGEPGAVAVIEPQLQFPAFGPIYFNREAVPDPALRETSVDGGILFINVSEGEYTLTATKPEVEFTTVRVKARPGVLVNASPPYEVKSDQE